jgi:pyridoxal phosphate enzyme (YggS family)
MIRDNIRTLHKAVPDTVTIVCVSKGRTIDQIKEVIASGITDIGENKVQEALLKYNALRAMSCEPGAIKWHMVGHLQTNKARDAVRVFDLIQSVDSLHLAEEIDRQAARIGKAQEILIEVKTSHEISKYGFLPEQAVEAVIEIGKFKNLKLQGLMTIAPMVSNPEESRPYFRMLRALRDKLHQLQITNYQLPILSMGMTDDYKIAIEEGANMIRLGRAIFEG